MITIPVRVFEHFACTYKIVDGEIILLVKQACTTTDNLLKLHHVLNRAHQYDVAHIAGINACTQLIGGSQDSGQQFLVVLEGSQCCFSHFAIIGGHALTIVAGRTLFMLVHHIANYHRMLLGSTEDDGLFVRVNLVQQLLHTVFVTLLNLYSAIIEIRLRVNLFHVYLSTLHDIAFLILVVVNVARRDVHTERNKETVFDSLFQRIGIYRLSKVGIGIGIVLSSWCGSHTQLISAVKVLHQLSPLTFVIGSTSMTFVYNNEVKEVTFILHIVWLVLRAFRQCDALFLCLLCVGRSHHGLENGEIQVAGCWHLVVVFLQLLGSDTAHSIFWELVEIVDGLIGKDISVGNKQNSWRTFHTLGIPLCLCQLPTDLESRIGLTRSCCHRQQDTITLLGYGLQHILDGYLLIVARLAAFRTFKWTKIELIAPRILFWEGHLPQILWRREIVYILFLAGDDICALAILHAHVDEPYFIAIGAIGIANLQCIGILLCLIYSCRYIQFVALRLYHRQFDTLVFKDIVCLLRVLVASSSDATRCNISTLLH